MKENLKFSCMIVSKQKEDDSMRKQGCKKMAAILLVVAVALSLFLPVQAAETYLDVPGDAWYAQAVENLTEQGIMVGVGNGKFSPDSTFTRAQLATVLYRLAGTPAVTGEDEFTDTRSGQWYSDAVTWAASEGVVQGYGKGRFGPMDPVTQEQMAVMLWRSAGSYVLKNDDTDTLGASDYAVNGVRWAIVDGLISDDGPAFRPKAPATRGQVADMVFRYLGLLEKFSDVDGISGATTSREEPQDTARAKRPGKILIAYFSRAEENYHVGVINEGNTAKFAREIAAQTGGDLFEIVPTVPYPSGYNETLSIATEERNSGARPEIAKTVSNFQQYDTIFIGYPIWWGDLPMILHTFMESYDFTGKTVIPFNTHEGSGQSVTQTTIQEKLTGATVLQGLAMLGETAQKLSAPYGSDPMVHTWLDGLGIAQK